MLCDLDDSAITKFKSNYHKMDLSIIDDFDIGELLTQMRLVLFAVVNRQSSVGGPLLISGYSLAILYGLLLEAFPANAIRIIGFILNKINITIQSAILVSLATAMDDKTKKTQHSVGLQR